MLKKITLKMHLNTIFMLSEKKIWILKSGCSLKSFTQEKAKQHERHHREKHFPSDLAQKVFTKVFPPSPSPPAKKQQQKKPTTHKQWTSYAAKQAQTWPVWLPTQITLNLTLKPDLLFITRMLLLLCKLVMECQKYSAKRRHTPKKAYKDT